MGLFNIFKNKDKDNINDKDKKSSEEKKDYSYLIEAASIISNNDEDVKSNITLLVNNIKAFIEKNSQWCEDMNVYEETDPHYIFAYYICGYDTDFTYGHYIDWKEETDDIICGLERAIKKLGYPLSLEDIEFTYEESTEEALKKINEHFMKSGYNLFGIDTNGDCYHLFIATEENYKKINGIMKNIIDFSNI